MEKLNRTNDITILPATNDLYDIIDNNNLLLNKNRVVAGETAVDIQQNITSLKLNEGEIPSVFLTIENKPGQIVRRYRRTHKPRKQMKPRSWRTRKDPFDEVWHKIRIQLELSPDRTAKSLLEDLIKEKPDQFTINLLRTLQRRVAIWRMQEIKVNQERNYQKVHTKEEPADIYTSLEYFLIQK